MKYEKELNEAISAAKKAQEWILKIYETPFEIEIKSDDSPVTAADKGADEIIRKHLSSVFPEDGFLTEESKDTGERLSHERVWIVDPVDGTKEFVSRNGEFTTNIALSYKGEIVVGVINVPVLGITYYAVKGEGAYRVNEDGSVDRIHVSDKDESLITVRSRSFFNQKEEEWLERNKGHIAKVDIYGAALKFCRIAEGRADIQYRNSSSTKEWDVAPGDLLVHEAGGVMRKPDGERFTYNRVDVYNREGYSVANKESNLLK